MRKAVFRLRYSLILGLPGVFGCPDAAFGGGGFPGVMSLVAAASDFMEFGWFRLEATVVAALQT